MFDGFQDKMVEQEKKLRAIVRIMNTDIMGYRQLHQALTQIRGVSFMFSNAVCKKLSLPRDMKVGELSDEQVKSCEAIIKKPIEHGLPSWLLNRRRDPESGEDSHLVMSDLKLRTEFDIRNLKKVKSYRGMRHSVGLPVRGQRTKAHFRHGASLGVQKKKVEQQKKDSANKGDKK